MKWKMIKLRLCFCTHRYVKVVGRYRGDVGPDGVMLGYDGRVRDREELWSVFIAQNVQSDSRADLKFWVA